MNLIINVASAPSTYIVIYEIAIYKIIFMIFIMNQLPDEFDGQDILAIWDGLSVIN